ncbi:hypothetical protein P9775_006786 [Pseudomonas aeruginosa]|jgi:hypothetical protein|uniref:hypothetical protein n=1 Tax=Pseudomonas aeruginosa TaxID=287 RepID=UPI0013966DDD|nr:hypothetical protein [Pseudomonas aeruginosa]MEA3220727.1 hypothetical protein [Immundisolibacter sp.]EIZ0539848.1 hypothetical protein [Pseudomonas aeruginosa]EKV4130255.1 hypothetical protein [Pseudomonas aeruginosa]EKW0413279.1 hypothetical protein [Pseudomonas aeruginosa]EKW1417661.1 hypothetical protein [Pseudomonas aeruginosa]
MQQFLEISKWRCRPSSGSLGGDSCWASSSASFLYGAYAGLVFCPIYNVLHRRWRENI